MAVSNEQKLLKERMRVLLSAKGKTASDLGETDNEKKIYQRKIHQESLITFDTIYKVLYMFPDISADWLVMGEGRMKKDDHIAPRVYTQHNEVHDNRVGGDITVGSDVHAIPSIQEVERLRARISELEKDKRNLESYLAIFTRHAESYAAKTK